MTSRAWPSLCASNRRTSFGVTQGQSPSRTTVVRASRLASFSACERPLYGVLALLSVDGAELCVDRLRMPAATSDWRKSLSALQAHGGRIFGAATVRARRCTAFEVDACMVAICEGDRGKEEHRDELDVSTVSQSKPSGHSDSKLHKTGTCCCRLRDYPLLPINGPLQLARLPLRCLSSLESFQPV